MKTMAAISVALAAMLAAAAVWLGALNQDEGWYIYAATLVAENRLPYRDFFFTQAPLMPLVYSAFSFAWESMGLLGARLVTAAIGMFSVVFTVGIARNLAPQGSRAHAALAALLATGCNLYHVYYLSIPKTYALASLFVMLGYYLLTLPRANAKTVALAGAALAFAAATRISMGALVAVQLAYFVWRRRWTAAFAFALAASAALALVFVPFLSDQASREGFLAAQQYHAARGSGDIVWTLGSLSRLVRWYLPLWVVAGLAVAFAPRSRWADVAQPLGGFFAVFLLQLLAPFPYDDYQVPVMGLLAASAAALFAGSEIFSRREAGSLAVLGMALALAIGSPLVQDWMCNAQDRFWSRKKPMCELKQLREVARRIEKLDPGGKTLFTQDTYLAVETGRKVPRGLEMGPFSMLSDEEWKNLIESAPCPVAAMSGYTFAIEPPVCSERAIDKQLEYWKLLRKHYRMVEKEPEFGQNATTLLLLKRR